MKGKRNLAYFGRRVIFSQIAPCPQKAVFIGKQIIACKKKKKVGLKTFSREMLCFYFFNNLDPYSIKSFANHFFPNYFG